MASLFDDPRMAETRRQIEALDRAMQQWSSDPRQREQAQREQRALQERQAQNRLDQENRGAWAAGVPRPAPPPGPTTAPFPGLPPPPTPAGLTPVELISGPVPQGPPRPAGAPAPEQERAARTLGEQMAQGMRERGGAIAAPEMERAFAGALRQSGAAPGGPGQPPPLPPGFRPPSPSQQFAADLQGEEAQREAQWRRQGRQRQPQQPPGTLTGMLAESVGLGGAMAAAAGPVAAVMLAMQQMAGMASRTASALDALGNASLTRAQRERKFIEELPIIGGLFRSFHQLVDVVSGTTEAIRRAQARMALAGPTQGLEGELRGRIMGLDTEQAAREARARATAANMPQGDIRLSREAGPQGDRERRFQLAMIEAREGQRRAQIEVDVARAGVRQAERNVRAVGQRDYAVGFDPQTGAVTERVRGADLERRSREAWAAVHRARAALNTEQAPRDRGRDIMGFLGAVAAPGAGIRGFSPHGDQQAQARRNIAEAIGRARALEAAQAQRANAQAQAGIALGQQRVNLAQQESAARQRALEIDRIRLGVLTEQTQRLREGATSYGGMDPARRAAFIQTAEYARRFGSANLMPEQRALLAQGGAGEFLRREDERRGLADPNYLRALRGLGLDRNALGQRLEGRNLGEGIEGLRVQEDRLRTQLRQAMAQDTATLARGVADAVNGGIGRLLDAIRQQIQVAIDARIREILLGFQFRNLVQ